MLLISKMRVNLPEMGAVKRFPELAISKNVFQYRPAWISRASVCSTERTSVMMGAGTSTAGKARARPALVINVLASLATSSRGIPWWFPVKRIVSKPRCNVRRSSPKFSFDEPVTSLTSVCHNVDCCSVETNFVKEAGTVRIPYKE